MPAVESTLAAWLKKERLDSLTDVPGINWGDDRTVEIDYMTPLDTKADAAEEGARHAAFLGGPLVKDVVVVKGSRRDLLGRVVTVSFERLGYVESGRDVFVIGVAENPDNGTTALTVLRSLG